MEAPEGQYNHPMMLLNCCLYLINAMEIWQGLTVVTISVILGSLLIMGREGT